METLRIVPSEEEASLHPRAIWNHWKKNVIWDHRTYYGILEFIGGLSVVLGTVDIRLVAMGLLLICAIAPLHWYSNHRTSTHVLIRARTHIAVILFLIIIVTAFQIYSLLSPECSGCDREDIERGHIANGFLWLSIPILMLTVAVLYIIARNPRKDPILAELPSPIDLEDEGRSAWADANVADGIEDDTPEPEGQVRLS